MKTHIILTKRNGNLILVPHAQLAAESDEQKNYTTISFPIPDTSGIIVCETIHEVEAKIADAICERGEGGGMKYATSPIVGMWATLILMHLAKNGYQLAAYAVAFLVLVVVEFARVFRDAEAAADDKAPDDQRLQDLAADNAVMIDALEKLARLGNGDRYGNSTGNSMAIDALAKLRRREVGK